MKDDIIYRQQAIDAVNEWLRLYVINRTMSNVTSIQDILRQLPSAQTQCKTGKWIKISPANIYECSECGKNVMTDDISAYDFCHGCGADMRCEQDG